MQSASDEERRLRRMENLLAGLLRYGAVVASGWIAVGMTLGMFADARSRQLGSIADRCMTIGIVLLITLPVVRVGLTTAVFLVERDYVFTLISGAVLAIIVLGYLLGTGGAH